MNKNGVSIRCLFRINKPWSFEELFLDLERNAAFERDSDGVKIRRDSEDKNDVNVEIRVDEQNVNILMKDEGKMEQNADVDVCVVGRWLPLDSTPEQIKQNVNSCKTKWPNVPIIIFDYIADMKSNPKWIGLAELNGIEIWSQKEGDKIAQEMGAVKYIQCSDKNNRSWRILLEEIAFAGLIKLRDEEELRKKAKEKKKDEGNYNLVILFVISVVVACIIYIITSKFMK